jgi:hypothetical protein
MPVVGAMKHRRQLQIWFINTNITLRSDRRQAVCELGVFHFSVSMRRLDHPLMQATQATGLWFACVANGGIDLLTALVRVN